MTRSPVKRALKRGALIAAANWPVTLIQASADSLFKLLLAAPLIGGVFLVGLVVRTEPSMLLLLGTRELVDTVAAALWAQPIVLTLLTLAIAVVGIGGSLFVFLIKAGTIATLVRSDHDAGAIEEPPLHLSAVARAARFSVETYIESARGLFPRYMRLGFGLMAVYLASGAGYWMLVGRGEPAGGWGLAALVTAAFVLWITVVNFLYLLVQIIVAADDCGVVAALRRVAAFLRHEWRHVTTVFLLVLAAVVAATGASLLATAALGLVAFVPFIGLAALPLQLFAWLLRGLVFQYLGLASVGAYLKLYRAFADARGRLRPAAAYGQAWRPAS